MYTAVRNGENAVFSRARKYALCYFIALIMLTTWIYRSLSFYARRHLILVLTAMLASAILSAALLTGASLHAQLRQNLRARLGAIQRVQFFPTSTIDQPTQGPTQTAALYSVGELLDAQGNCCANTLQVIGVPNLPIPDSAPPNAVLANARAAALLQGQSGFIRLRKPNALSVELPLGNAHSDALVRRAITLSGVATEPLGLIPPDFAFIPSTLPPPTIFIPLQRVNDILGLASNQVNLLVATDATPFPALTNLTDYGLHVQPATQTNCTFVSTSRIFLPRNLETRLQQRGLPTSAATFHLADSFAAHTNTTPYGFVAALAPEQMQTYFGLTVATNEIIINDWLSRQLNVTTNQALTLTWRRFEADGTLIADSRTFTVRAMIATERAAQTRSLMPTFPGMKDVDSCAHWDIGLPMDEEKLNDPANETYWKTWRETPKAFVAWQIGTHLFGTHFGAAMTLQIAAPTDRVTHALLTCLTTEDAGGQTLDLNKTGEQAAQGSTDFNGLFVGMAFILMVSALILLSLSFSRVLDARKQEIATLRAIGWSPRTITTALLAEWTFPLTVAALAGATAGTGLAHGLITGLNRFWSSAFAGGHIAFYFSRGPLLLAAAIGWGLTFSVLFFKAAKWSRTTPTQLWQTAPREQGMTPPTRQRLRALHLAGSLCAAISLALLFTLGNGTGINGVFFAAGFLLLLSLLAFTYALLLGLRTRPGIRSSPVSAGLARIVQHPARALQILLLLALGSFLVIGILAMKNDPLANIKKSSSGSGGFASIVTSVLPQTREAGIEQALAVTGAKHAVPLRVEEGDQAGCLNLNAPTRPQVLGVDPEVMTRIRAFEPDTAGGTWSPLQDRLPDGTIPALAADYSMLQFSLKAKADPLQGTCYAYPQGTIRIVGVLPVRSSILQGAVIINEKHFAQLFPNTSGYRLWLCDYAPYLLRDAARDTSRHTSPRLRDNVRKLKYPRPGVTVETVEERLRLLASVESTYLDMFLVLGGLGLIIGTWGIALIVWREIDLRRPEFITLRALGIPARRLITLLLAEFGTLGLVGLCIGILPALAAVAPLARQLGSAIPWHALLLLIALVFGTLLLALAVSARALFLHTRTLSDAHED